MGGTREKRKGGGGREGGVLMPKKGEGKRSKNKIG